MAIVIETWMAEDLDLGVGDVVKTHQSGGTIDGHGISLSTFSRKGAAGVADTTTWDPAAIDSGSSVTTTVTVAGAALGDFVLASLNIDLQGLIMNAYVSAENTVTVVLSNLTGTPGLNIGSGTLKVLVFATR
jgi:hypothetical protein